VTLDCSRMLLWSPEEDSDVEELEKESNMIQSAVDALKNEDYATCIADIESLRTMNARTVFADAVATTLESQLPDKMAPFDTLGRFAAVTRAVQDFQELMLKADILDKSFGLNQFGARKALNLWVPHLTKWLRSAENRYSDI
jgi:hypothetical protein